MGSVVLHIGTHKTGTTALQEFVAENGAAFARQGLTCYQLARRYSGIQKSRSGYFLYKYAKAVADQEQGADLDATTLENIAAFQSAVSEHESVLLSDERLWYQGATNPQTWRLIKELFDDVGVSDVRVVVYFRRQDQFIASLWSQWVKGRTRLTSTLTDFAATPTSLAVMDYRGSLKDIEEVFGEGCVTVGVFDRAEMVGADIRRDFCELLGIDITPEFTFGDSGSNPGLTSNIAEIKRQVNFVPEYRELDNFLREPAISASAIAAGVQGGGDAPHLPPEAVRDILKRYEQGNEEIARKFLRRSKGTLFRSPSPDGGAGGDGVNYEGLIRDVVRFYAAALSQEHARVLELEERVKRLERAPRPRSLKSVATSVVNRLKR